MMKPRHILLIVSLALLNGCHNTIAVDISKDFAVWDVSNSSSAPVSWADFQWASGTLGGTYYEKIAMLVPCKMEGVTNPLTLQLDLRAELTGPYEGSYSSFYITQPELKNKIKSFDGSNSYFENITLYFGTYTAINQKGYVYPKTGSNIPNLHSTDTVQLGTIGADIFQNKVMIIDYPNKRFAICDGMPTDYASNLIDINLDNDGRVILPMSLRAKNYNILFDTGSSLFPLITETGRINEFTTSAAVDVIQITSFGKPYTTTGRVVEDTITLAGKKFGSVKAYSSDKPVDAGIDAITGNALFWNGIIVIDFKHKKFGIK